MKGRATKYSVAEMEWLEANRLMVISEYHSAFVAAFGRDDVSAPCLHALRQRKGWKTGRTGCFVKGHATHNKGIPWAPGKGGRHPDARKWQFKTGELNGMARRKYKPIGTERLDKDGYLERKIHDGAPQHTRWQLVHRLEWESINGPVPKGMALKCLADRLNTDPSNWELVPRALLPRINGGRASRTIAYDTAPVELRPAILAIAKIDQRSADLRKAQP